MINKTKIHQIKFYSQHIFWIFIDLVYPPECAGCQKIGDRWCRDCQSKVEFVSAPYCKFCGDVIQQGNVCSHCKKSRPPYERLRSWSVFKEPVRGLLHTLKYQRGLGLGDLLTKPLAAYFQSLNWPIDVIVPLPLSTERMVERGYNQADLVAWPLAEYLGLDYFPDSLRRVRHTHSQVGLSAEERVQNVKGAFLATSDKLAGRTVLLIDDVVTTGATTRAAAQALIDAGAAKVYGFSIARALAVHGWDAIGERINVPI